MSQRPIQRHTVLDTELADLLKGWTPADQPPPDDRVVLIVRVSPIGKQLLLRDMGYYEDGNWMTVHGHPMHPVKAWHPYPELPDYTTL